METKSTPGPWIIEGLTVWSDERGRSAHVCKIMPRHGEDEANARLIAAAPELLEACKAVLANLEWAAPDHALVSTKGVEACKAALAKATP